MRLLALLVRAVAREAAVLRACLDRFGASRVDDEDERWCGGPR